MQQNEIANEFIRCLAAAGIAAKRGKPAQIGDHLWSEILDAGGIALCRLTLLPDGNVGIHSYCGRYIECDPAQIPTAADAIAGNGPRNWRDCGFRTLESRSAR